MITVSVDPVSLKEIEDRLGSMRSKAPVLLKKSVNEAARQVLKEIKKDTREKYILSVNDVNEKMILNGKATTIRPRLYINIKGRPYNLLHFNVTPNSYDPKRKKVLKARVKRGETLKPLINNGNKAFIGRFSNQYGKTDTITVMQRKGKERFPIKKLRGPSMPIMAHTVWEDNENDYRQRLRQSVEKHIAEIMGG